MHGTESHEFAVPSPAVLAREGTDSREQGAYRGDLANNATRNTMHQTRAHFAITLFEVSAEALAHV